MSDSNDNADKALRDAALDAIWVIETMYLPMLSAGIVIVAENKGVYTAELLLDMSLANNIDGDAIPSILTKVCRRITRQNQLPRIIFLPPNLSFEATARIEWLFPDAVLRANPLGVRTSGYTLLFWKLRSKLVCRRILSRGH